jgi:hypothetical protein
MIKLFLFSLYAAIYFTPHYVSKLLLTSMFGINYIFKNFYFHTSLLWHSVIIFKFLNLLITKNGIKSFILKNNPKITFKYE